MQSAAYHGCSAVDLLA